MTVEVGYDRAAVRHLARDIIDNSIDELKSPLRRADSEKFFDLNNKNSTFYTWVMAAEWSVLAVMRRVDQARAGIETGN